MMVGYGSRPAPSGSAHPMHVDEDDLALPLSTLAALTSFLEEQSVTQDALAALNVSQPMSLPDFKRIFKCVEWRSLA